MDSPPESAAPTGHAPAPAPPRAGGAAAADPLGLYNTNMGADAQGGVTRSGSSGSYTYAVKPGFADKPVNFVSFYDSLRFTNWLNNGQGSAGTDVTTVCAAPGATPNTANCGNVVGSVTDVGAFTGSASPNGTFDQGGNVWEWNEQIVDGSNRGIRGGSWDFIAGNLAASGRGVAGPAGEGGGVGFRVASLPEPGTGLLLMTGLAGLAARQERRKRNL